MAGSITYGSGSRRSSRRSASDHDPAPERLNAQRSPRGVTSAPSLPRIRTGAIRSAGEASSREREMLPSRFRRGSSAVLRTRQRHVLEPWRFETVRNSSVRCGPTVMVSRPKVVGRETPPAKRVHRPRLTADVSVTVPCRGAATL